MLCLGTYGRILKQANSEIWVRVRGTNTSLLRKSPVFHWLIHRPQFPTRMDFLAFHTTSASIFYARYLDATIFQRT